MSITVFHPSQDFYLTKISKFSHIIDDGGGIPSDFKISRFYSPGNENRILISGLVHTYAYNFVWCRI